MAKCRGFLSSQIASSKPVAPEFELDGVLGEHIGLAERTGAWIVYGDSGQGKTRFCLQLSRELARHAKVGYISLEEGLRGSFKKAIKSSNLDPVNSSIVFYRKLDYVTLLEMLAKRKSPNVIFIDSLQYFKHTEDDDAKNFTLWDYKRLLERFPRKLFIFISHMDGKKPSGSLGKRILYDADVKIQVDGGIAFIKSRYADKDSEYRFFG